jgi:cholesterol transport system auxiliary component
MMLSLKKNTTRAFAVALLALLSACITLIEEPAPSTVYSLRANSVASADWPSVDWGLTLMRPNSSPFLDSNRIAVRPQGNEMQVYAGSSWSEALPDLVQTQLLESFENSAKLKTVTRQISGVPADVGLMLDIREFESVYVDGKKSPTVIIQIHAKLLELPSSRVIANNTFHAEIPSASKEIPDVVNAFEAGLKHANREIVAWTLAYGHEKSASVK